MEISNCDNNILNNITINELIIDQLVEMRKIHHDNYIRELNDIPCQENKWPTGTILTSDSICNNLDEKRLSRNNRVKVRSFPVQLLMICTIIWIHY